MKMSVLGTLAMVAAMTAGQAAHAGQCPPNSSYDHTVSIYTFGFFPDRIFVCPGDRLRFQSKSPYRMKVNMSNVDWRPEEEDQYADFNSGNLSYDNFSGWLSIGPDSAIEFDPALADYSYGANNPPYSAELVIGSPPTEYATGERYSDPQPDPEG